MKKLKINPGDLSYHLKVLEKLKLIKKDIEKHYTITPLGKFVMSKVVEIDQRLT